MKETYEYGGFEEWYEDFAAAHPDSDLPKTAKELPPETKKNLITHELQPFLAGDKALEEFALRPMRGAGSWRPDRIFG